MNLFVNRHEGDLRGGRGAKEEEETQKKLQIECEISNLRLIKDD